MLKAAPQRSRQLVPGDALGKYEVIRQIAIGGMAELYLVRTQGIEGFEKLVVLKRILPQYVTNAGFVEMFLNEARLAATLHHPNVAQVYDIGVDGGEYFFAMEYVHGEDLDRIASAADEQGVPLSLDAALTLVAGLCAGLHYAHDKASPDGKPLQIVHRDVSPSNVIVSYDGAVKLVDFGIARAASQPGRTHGGLKGKIAYMSPEQCRERAHLDRRSDVFSIGTILYQLTTGRLPFDGETEYQILNQIVNDDVPAPTTIVPGYPPALEAIVLRALARDVDRRYATALELQGAIEDFAHDSRLRVSPLVLARLMGTLFPSRLEEWDQAKAQGAFFVEQQVVRTLIESGRTPSRGTPRGVVAEEETTVNQSLTYLGDDTTGMSLPIATKDSSQVAVPVVASYSPYSGGTLVTSATPALAPGTVQATSAQADVTERVRTPMRRAPSPTIFVRTSPIRGTWLALGAGLAVIGGIAAALAVARDDKKPAAPRAAEPPPASHVQMSVKAKEAPAPAPSPAVAAPAPPVAPPPAPAPAVEPTPSVAAPEVSADPEPIASAPAPAPRHKKKSRAGSAKRAAAKPAPRDKHKARTPEAKSPSWNADSPFMPVRTDKDK